MISHYLFVLLFANSIPMKKYLIIVSSIVMLVCVGCTSSKWAESDRWFESGKAVNDSLVDVFYIVSTEILDEKDGQGRDSYIGKLTEEERKAIDAELKYAQDMFGDSFNYFAPYYEQFTMSSINLSPEEFKGVRHHAMEDVKEAFQYYLHHLNNGRPYILAGFSQGGMHLIDILRDIDPKDYERMVAAYSIGYRLSADDLSHPCVKAAEGADDRGVIVSFNSVASVDDIWPVVNEGAATCINPVNYCTDATPATFTFEGDTLTVSVDTTNNVLIVDSKKIDTYRFPVLERFCKPGNLHHFDLLFYKDAIRRNVMQRSK